MNYFGGFEDLALVLSQLGYIVIVARLGPISTNRERACELFAQLTNINSIGPGRNVRQIAEEDFRLTCTVDLTCHELHQRT